MEDNVYCCVSPEILRKEWEEDVRFDKQLRKDIDVFVSKLHEVSSSRERSLAITKLQEAVMWLGMDLKRLGTSEPYPESKNPESLTIHPTADGLKM
jgi:hypothetical protein